MVDGCVPAPRFCSFVFGHDAEAECGCCRVETGQTGGSVIAWRIQGGRQYHQRTPDRRSDCAQLRSLALMPYNVESSQLATQNRAGASTQPCLTPEVVTKRCDRSWPSRTCAPVFSCRLMIKSSSRVSGTPLPRRAFHSASLSTESKLL